MTNHARIAAEEISRWVCSVIVKYDGPISHFDGSNPFEQIIAPHFAQAIADATAEQGRRAEWYALLARAAMSTAVAYNANGSVVIHPFRVLGDPDAWPCDKDANGLPIETPELRAALEAALNKE
jgi:hypothetical protein